MTKQQSLALEGALLSVAASLQYMRLAFKEARDAGLPGVMQTIQALGADIEQIRGRLETLHKEG